MNQSIMGCGIFINAETKKVAIIAAQCERYGDEAKEVAAKDACDYGVSCGKKVIKE